MGRFKRVGSNGLFGMPARILLPTAEGLPPRSHEEHEDVENQLRPNQKLRVLRDFVVDSASLLCRLRSLLRA